MNEEKTPRLAELLLAHEEELEAAAAARDTLAQRVALLETQRQVLDQRIEMLEGRPEPLAAALKEISGWLSLHEEDGAETIVAIRDMEIVGELSCMYPQCKARVCMATGDTIAVRETLAEIMAMLADRPAAPRPPEGPLFVRLAVLEAKLAAHLESIGQLAAKVQALEARDAH